jgi:hypothetical protein
MLVPTAALVGLAGAARANEATTLRVVSVARSAGGATVVVSVPTRLAATAAEPGAFRIATAQGQVVTPGVAALDPASTAVGVVVDVPPDASPDQARQVVGTAAELVRSVDPATPLTVAFTRGVDPPLPLGTDRAAQLAALAHVAQPVVAARGTAVQAAAAQLVVGNFVAPMIVVVDTATVVEPVAAAGAIRVVSIPVAAPVDPISLVDDAVALTQGRFALTIPGAGAGALQITLGQGTGALSATVAAAPATGTPTTVATSALRPPTTPTVAGARVTPPAAPASSAASGSSAARVTPKAPATAATGAAGTSSIGVVVGVVLGVVAAGAAGVLIVRRRRPGDEARGDTEVAVTLAPAHADPSPPAPVVRGYYYTDFTDAPPAPQESPTPPPVVEANGHAVASGADEVYARRLRVLALAEELGNISEACRVVGVSRRSFYEWKRLAEEQGPEALYPKRSRSPDS